MPTAYCPLPTAYCLLPTAYCLLPTAYCPLPTAYCLLPTDCCLPTTHHSPLTTYHFLLTSEQMTVLWNLVEVMLAFSSMVHTTEKASRSTCWWSEQRSSPSRLGTWLGVGVGG
jgi:hypothetical protein